MLLFILSSIIKVIGSFYLLFNVIRQGWEEIDSGDAFYFVHAVDIGVQWVVARCIFINKTDGFRWVAVCAEYDFEKCFGYGDCVFFR